MGDGDVVPHAAGEVGEGVVEMIITQIPVDILPGEQSVKPRGERSQRQQKAYERDAHGGVSSLGVFGLSDNCLEIFMIK
jgi:hypothetical protein